MNRTLWEIVPIDDYNNIPRGIRFIFSFKKYIYETKTDPVLWRVLLIRYCNFCNLFEKVQKIILKLNPSQRGF